MSVGEILERDEDRPAYVRFEQRAVKDNEATLREGHYISKDEEFVLITPAYSKDCIEQKVSAWGPKLDELVTRGRVPAKHRDFWLESLARWRKGLEPPVDGTSVKDWSTISPAQSANLIAAGCRTVEDLAQANDEAMRRLGMGGNDLRNKARTWLQAAKDHGPLTMEVTQLKNENGQLKGSIQSLQEQIKLLQIQMEGKNEANEMPIHATVEFEESLAEQYIRKFGKPPHHKLADKTILERIQRGEP